MSFIAFVLIVVSVLVLWFVYKSFRNAYEEAKLFEFNEEEAKRVVEGLRVQAREHIKEQRRASSPRRSESRDAGTQRRATDTVTNDPLTNFVFGAAVMDVGSSGGRRDEDDSFTPYGGSFGGGGASASWDEPVRSSHSSDSGSSYDPGPDSSSSSSSSGGGGSD